jgi:hypothetical protein
VLCALVLCADGMAKVNKAACDVFVSGNDNPPARGVHLRNGSTEDLNPAKTRHTCCLWSTTQPLCTFKLMALRRDLGLARDMCQW